MDIQTVNQSPIFSQPPPPVTQTFNKKNPLMMILILTLTLILTILILSAYTTGLLIWSGLYTLSPQNFPNILIKKNVIFQQDLPFNIAFLKNPAITQWRVGVEGKLVKKDQDSFVLEKDGVTLTIGFDKTFTGFMTPPTEDQTFGTSITFEEVPIGSYLQGGVTIYPRTGIAGPNVVGDLMNIRNSAQ